MLSQKQEIPVRYIAELTKSVEGKRVSLGTKDFDAADDAEAIQKAEEWVAPLVDLHFNEVIHMQVARNGHGMFGKLYGDL